MLALCAHVGRITVMKQCLYCYCENLESTTHTYLPDRFERVKTNYEKHVELCRACSKEFWGFLKEERKNEQR